MNNNSEILSLLVEEDFGLKVFGDRYSKSIEHDSLVIDRDRGIFFWNSEGIVGDPLVYLTRVRNYSFERARDYLRTFNYSGVHVYTIKSNNEDIVVYPELVDVFYDLGRNNRDYFYKRGLTDLTIDRFQLGFYNGFNTIPIFDGGTFRNFQMRKDDPKTIRPYYKGVGGLLFNSDILKITDTVYVVEGPVDAMALSQNNLPAVSTTIGGTVQAQWYNKFTGIKNIYLVMDNDDAGRKEAIKSAKVLGVTRCKIYTFDDTEVSGYDPVDYFRDGNTADDFVRIVKENSKYVFELEQEKRRYK